VIKKIIVLGCSHTVGVNCNISTLWDYFENLPGFEIQERFKRTNWIEEIRLHHTKNDWGRISDHTESLATSFRGYWREAIEKVRGTGGIKDIEWPWMDKIEDMRWSGYLQKLSGIEVINYGLGGENSFTTLQNCIEKIDYKNTLVLWSLTYPHRDKLPDDLYGILGLKDYSDYMSSMVNNFFQLVEEKGGKFKCWFTDYWWSQDYKDYVLLSNEIKDKLLFDDFLFNYIPKEMKWRRLDGTHYDEVVHEWLGEFIYEKLVETKIFLP